MINAQSKGNVMILKKGISIVGTLSLLIDYVNEGSFPHNKLFAPSKHVVGVRFNAHFMNQGLTTTLVIQMTHFPDGKFILVQILK